MNEPIRRDWLNGNLPEIMRHAPRPMQETNIYAELLFGDPQPGDPPIECEDPALAISLHVFRKVILH